MLKANKSILALTILLTIVLEIILISLVNIEIGEKRLPFQLSRLGLQLFLILLIYLQKSQKALFILSAFHYISSILIWGNYSFNQLEFILLIAYHFIIASVFLYYYVVFDKLEEKNKRKRKNYFS